MVAVVVGEQNAGDVAHVDFVARQALGHDVGVDAGVDEDAALGVAKVGAVARRAAAERDKHQLVARVQAFGADVERRVAGGAAGRLVGFAVLASRAPLAVVADGRHVNVDRVEQAGQVFEGAQGAAFA